MRYRFWKLDESGHEVRSREIVLEVPFTSYVEDAGFRVLDWGQEGIITLTGEWYAEKM